MCCTLSGDVTWIMPYLSLVMVALFRHSVLLKLLKCLYNQVQTAGKILAYCCTFNVVVMAGTRALLHIQNK